MQRAISGGQILKSIEESCVCAALSILPVLASILFDLPGALNLVSDGVRSPLSDYIAGAVVAVLLHLLIGLLFLSNPQRFLLNLLWVPKVWVTLFFALYYEAKYASLDAIEYFLSGALESQSFQQRFIFGDGTNNMKYFIFILTHGITPSYHMSKVFCAFIGFLGLIGYFKGVIEETKSEDWRMLLLLMLTPSILFWTSILGKDPLVTLFLGWHFYFLQRFLYSDTKRKTALIASIGMLLLSGYIRVWIPAIFGISMVFGLAIMKRKSAGGVFLFIGSFLAIALGARYFALTNVNEVVAYFDRASKLWARGGSSQIAPTFHDFYDLLAFAPTGAMTALFRPLPGDVEGILGFLSGTENLLLLLACSISIILIFVFGLYSASRAYIFSSIVFWSLIYGFVSYQNLGTGIRFRNQIAPLLVIWLYLVIRSFCKKARNLNSKSIINAPVSDNFAANS